MCSSNQTGSAIKFIILKFTNYRKIMVAENCNSYILIDGVISIQVSCWNLVESGSLATAATTTASTSLT